MANPSEMGKKGGDARAKSLTKAERSAIARQAAESRWAKEGNAPIPEATHAGEIQIGDIAIPCAVLADGRRLLTQQGMLQAIGRARSAKGGQGATQGIDKPPAFLAAKNLKPFITNALKASTTPVRFKSISGTPAFGYVAELLPQICNVYLSARDANALTGKQLPIAVKCDILVRGLANVGIVALVDEATGYQKDRARDDLARILEAFVAKELQTWVSTFPPDYYEHLFRLWEMPYDTHAPKIKRPRFFGTLTNNLIYARLAPGVLAKLREKNPVKKSGKRSHKHFQHLTRNEGYPKLKEHLAAVTALMRASKNKEMFLKLMDSALPRYIDMPLFEDQTKD